MQKKLIVCLLMLNYAQSSLSADIKKNNNSSLPKKDIPMIDIGLPAKVLTEITDRLQKLLANTYTLYIKTQKYHWNIEGSHFHDLHLMLDGQYNQLAEYNDAIAERVRALGVKAIGTLQEFSKLTTIQEAPGVNPGEQEMLADLLKGYEMIIKQLRDDIDATAKHNDMGTNNFLCDLIMKLEKTAWMLRATLVK